MNEWDLKKIVPIIFLFQPEICFQFFLGVRLTNLASHYIDKLHCNHINQKKKFKSFESIWKRRKSNFNDFNKLVIKLESMFSSARWIFEIVKRFEIDLVDRNSDKLQKQFVKNRSKVKPVVYLKQPMIIALISIFLHFNVNRDLTKELIYS